MITIEWMGNWLGRNGDEDDEKDKLQNFSNWFLHLLKTFLDKSKLKKKKRKKKLEENLVELEIMTTMPKNKSSKKNSGFSIIFEPWVPACGVSMTRFLIRI